MSIATMKRFLLLVVCALTWLTPLTAQQRNVTLWVTLGDSDQVVEIDAYTFKELRRITTDPRPHGLATSPDGSKVYIGSDRTGNFQVIDARSGTGAQQPGGERSTSTWRTSGDLSSWEARGF